MAKSLRSKWRRKCRAVKRERYNQKELERLKKALNNDPTKPGDVDMVEISKIATVVPKETIRSKLRSATAQKAKEVEAQMETNAKERVFNPKTLKDQHGTYPVWIHPRKIHKRKKAGKGKLKKKSK